MEPLKPESVLARAAVCVGIWAMVGTFVGNFVVLATVAGQTDNPALSLITGIGVSLLSVATGVGAAWFLLPRKQMPQLGLPVIYGACLLAAIPGLLWG